MQAVFTKEMWHSRCICRWRLSRCVALKSSGPGARSSYFFSPWNLYNSMRHHRLDNLKRSNSLCHSRSLSDAMGGDIFAVLRQELCNLKCQLETCPSNTQEIAAVLNTQVLEMLGYLESVEAQQNYFCCAWENNVTWRNWAIERFNLQGRRWKLPNCFNVLEEESISW